MNPRDKIFETVTKLFVYADEQDWSELQADVLEETLHLDMTSMGSEACNISSKELCEQWKEGFNNLDGVHHLVGNILIKSLTEDEARVTCYATATHFREAAVNGNTREFYGTYELILKNGARGWRISSFKFLFKFATGNLELK